MRDAVGLFFALQTQWLWTGAGAAGAFRTGINYVAVKPTADALNVNLTPAVFNDIRLLEGEALATWSKRQRG